MTIPFGRRQLMISLVAVPRPRPLQELSERGGTDVELAQLQTRNLQDALADRARWEALALLYGGPYPH